MNAKWVVFLRCSYNMIRALCDIDSRLAWRGRVYRYAHHLRNDHPFTHPISASDVIFVSVSDVLASFFGACLTRLYIKFSARFVHWDSQRPWTLITSQLRKGVWSRGNHDVRPFVFSILFLGNFFVPLAWYVHQNIVCSSNKVSMPFFAPSCKPLEKCP